MRPRRCSPRRNRIRKHAPRFACGTRPHPRGRNRLIGHTKVPSRLPPLHRRQSLPRANRERSPREAPGNLRRLIHAQFHPTKMPGPANALAPANWARKVDRFKLLLVLVFVLILVVIILVCLFLFLLILVFFFLFFLFFLPA